MNRLDTPFRLTNTEGHPMSQSSSSPPSTRALEAAQYAEVPSDAATLAPAGSIPARVFSGAVRRMLALLASASLPRPSRVVFSLTYEDGKEERVEIDATTGAISSSPIEAGPSPASPKPSGKLRPRLD